MNFSRILIFDDKGIFDDSVIELINKFGYAVLESISTEAEFYNLIDEYEPNIIIIDFNTFEQFKNKSSFIKNQRISKIFIVDDYSVWKSKAFDYTIDFLYLDKAASKDNMLYIIENSLRRHFIMQHSLENELRADRLLMSNPFAIIEIDFSKFLSNELIQQSFNNNQLSNQIGKKEINELIEITYCNKMALEYFEADSFDFFKNNIVNIISDDNLKLFEKLMEVIINEVPEYSLKGKFSTFKNNNLYINWQIRNISHLERDITKITLYGIEITQYETEILSLQSNLSSIMEANVVNLNEIEELKNTQKKSIEKNELLDDALFTMQSAFDNSLLGLCITELNGNIFKVNNKFLELFSILDKSLILSKNVGIVLRNPEAADKVIYELKNNGFYNGEIEISNKERERKIVHIAANSIYNKNNELRYYLGIFIDFTLVKNIENELSESEELYKFLVNNINDGIYMIENSKLIFANRSLIEMTGYTEEDILGKDFLEFIAPEDSNYVVNNYMKMLNGTAKKDEYSFHLMHKDRKTKILVSRTGSIINYKGKKVLIGRLINITNKKENEAELRKINEKLDEQIKVRTQGFLNANKMLMQEITNRKKAEEVLRDSELKLRIISEFISDFVYSGEFDLNNEFTFDWVQGAVASITGYNMDDLDKMKLGHISAIYKDDRDLYLNKLNMLRSNQSIVMQYRIVKPTGEIRWIKDYLKPIAYDNETGVCRIIGAVKDVDEAVNKEIEIKLHRSQLIELISYLEDSREYEKKKISKDIQNLLAHSITQLKLDLAVLIEEIQTEIEFETFNSIQSNIKNISEFLKNISYNLHPAMLENFGFIAAIEWFIEQNKTNNDVKFELKKNIEQLNIDRKFSNILFRITQDIITNAVKHSKADTIKIDIILEGAELIIRIIDNGIGFDIEQKIREKCFGLISIYERAKFSQIDLNISSNRNGTIAELNYKIL